MTRIAVRVERVFTGWRLVDGGALVFVEDGRIAGVESGGEVPAGWTVREYPGATLLPGLIDAHVHLCADSGPRALERLAEASAPEIGASIEDALNRQLAAGVTTVRDLGDQQDAVLRWRTQRGDGPTTRPRVIAAGAPITTMAGHCWSMGGAVDGVAEIRAAVRRRAELGADVVKIMASGGVLTPGTDTTVPQFTDDELRAAVDEAHTLGLPVTAHAHAQAAVRQALGVGVDGIEHCTCLTSSGIDPADDLIEELAAAGIVVCPTLGSDPTVVVPPEVIAFAAQAGITAEILQQAARRLFEGGVTLVAGSDAGIGPPKPHGLLPETLIEYVTAGIPPAAALTSATAAASTALRLDTKGRIEPGADADLVIVTGNPLDDITTLRNPVAIYLAGQPVGR